METVEYTLRLEKGMLDRAASEAKVRHMDLGDLLRASIACGLPALEIEIGRR